MRKHLMIFPGTGVDFLRAERSYDGVWLRSSQSTWLPHLLPAVYQSVEMADFSFSSFRELPMGDPSLMPLPPDSAPYQVIVLAPVGEPYPTQWGAVLFHSQTHPPCLACERFVPDSGGVKRVVQSFFSEEFIGGMRFPERRHAELWVRHSLKIHDMLPDAYEAPRWLQEQQGLTPEEAAQKMAAMRLPTPNYDRIRRQEHDQREAQQKAEEEAQREQDWKEAEAAADEDFAIKAVALDQLSRTMPEQEEPKVMSRDDIIQAREKRAKMAKATKSKVNADKRNAAAAEAWAKKVVAKLA